MSKQIVCLLHFSNSTFLSNLSDLISEPMAVHFIVETILEDFQNFQDSFNSMIKRMYEIVTHNEFRTAFQIDIQCSIAPTDMNLFLL